MPTLYELTKQRCSFIIDEYYNSPALIQKILNHESVSCEKYCINTPEQEERFYAFVRTIFKKKLKTQPLQEKCYYQQMPEHVFMQLLQESNKKMDDIFYGIQNLTSTAENLVVSFSELPLMHQAIVAYHLDNACKEYKRPRRIPKKIIELVTALSFTGVLFAVLFSYVETCIGKKIDKTICIYKLHLQGGFFDWSSKFCCDTPWHGCFGTGKLG